MNNLKEIRSNKNISVSELAKKTGISERYLRFIENGERNPSIKTALTICAVINEPVEKIFTNKMN